MFSIGITVLYSKACQCHVQFDVQIYVLSLFNLLLLSERERPDVDPFAITQLYKQHIVIQSKILGMIS